MDQTSTDWDAYYRRPAGPVKFTRRISAQKIAQTLGPSLDKPDLRICEFGGANSCFAEGFLQRKNVARYHIVDLNEFGVGLFRGRHASDPRATGEVANALSLPDREQAFDIVYSVGLIEHFNVEDTRRCIQSHFELCCKGGLVLITFPTPTALYRIIRAAAETVRMWRFPDERPLRFKEVESVCEQYGRIEHKSINWMIGLTQGYVLYRKTA